MRNVKGKRTENTWGPFFYFILFCFVLFCFVFFAFHFSETTETFLGSTKMKISTRKGKNHTRKKSNKVTLPPSKISCYAPDPKREIFWNLGSVTSHIVLWVCDCLGKKSYSIVMKDKITWGPRFNSQITPTNLSAYLILPSLSPFQSELLVLSVMVYPGSMLSREGGGILKYIWCKQAWPRNTKRGLFF